MKHKKILFTVLLVLLLGAMFFYLQNSPKSSTSYVEKVTQLRELLQNSKNISPYLSNIHINANKSLEITLSSEAFRLSLENKNELLRGICGIWAGFFDRQSVRQIANIQFFIEQGMRESSSSSDLKVKNNLKIALERCY